LVHFYHSLQSIIIQVLRLNKHFELPEKTKKEKSKYPEETKKMWEIEFLFPPQISMIALEKGR
jgi:hypothetical protein